MDSGGKEGEGYWKTIIETMADGLMVVDLKGRIVMVNNALENLTGYRRDELVGQSCRILDCSGCVKARAKGEGAYCRLFRGKEIKRAKCSFRKKDGARLVALKNASLLKNEAGKVIGGVETVTDLSDVVEKEKEIKSLRLELDKREGFHGIVGSTPVMQQVFALIESAAQSDAPIVVFGESGTGKELVARALHECGPRDKGPFIKVNCAALNESLLESELFGHVKGAFTGADRGRMGRFEAAHQGDIFLDEIGDIPLSTQVKLLRVLQEKEIEKVGDHRPIPIDVRIIAATNKDLAGMTREGTFREDLYYRIGVIPIHLPPLRDRREDIPILINSFVNHVGLKTGKPVAGLTDKAFDLLVRHSWPGNVRELMNAIEYAFVLCPGGSIKESHLPGNILPGNGLTAAKSVRFSDPRERDRLLAALNEAGGNKTRAAKILGISRVSLYKRIKKHGLQVEKNVVG